MADVEYQVQGPSGMMTVTAPAGASDADIIARARAMAGSGQELSAPREKAVAFDPYQEMGAFPRLLASLKLTPQGRQGLFKSMGYDVYTDPSGEQFVREPGGKKVYPVDRPAFTAADVADIGGDVLQAVPTMLAGTNPFTVGVAGLLGNVARQGISAMMPGEDDMSAKERLQSAAIDTALASGSQAGINKILGGTFSGAAKRLPTGQEVPGGFDVMRPKNVFRDIVLKAERNPASADADVIEREIGLGLTPGQRTQSKSLLTVEGMLRRNPFSADKWQEADQIQLGKTLDYLNKTLEGVRPGGVGPVVAGGSVNRAFDDVMQKALRARSAQGRMDFEAVDALSNGKGVFEPVNARNAIDELIKKYDVAGGGDEASSVVSRLKALRADFADKAAKEIGTGTVDPITGKTVTRTIPGEARKLTGDEMQRLLGIYGSAAAGTGKIWSDLDSAMQRKIARDVMNALVDDMSAAAESTVAGDTAEALLRARSNWKANSKVINDMEESVLGRIFGGEYQKAPERVAEQFVNMRPTEIKNAFSLLDKSSPETAQTVKRYLIEDAMRKAGTVMPDSAAPQRQTLGADVFSPARFLSAIKESPVWSTLNTNEQFQMTTVFRAMERLAERAGTEGSPTAPLAQAFDAIKSMFSVNPVAMASGAAAMVAPRKASDALLTPEGRRALVQISTTPPGTKNFMAAAAYLGAISKKND
jgi:hypothetical protein